MIDHQVDYIHSKSLLQLGEWMAKQYKRSIRTRIESELEIQGSGIESEALQEQWKAQVHAQTRPLTGGIFHPIQEWVLISV
jgi:hypothetical protein